MWRDTPENEKQIYQQEYENEKVIISTQIKLKLMSEMSTEKTFEEENLRYNLKL